MEQPLPHTIKIISHWKNLLHKIFLKWNETKREKKKFIIAMTFHFSSKCCKKCLNRNICLKENKKNESKKIICFFISILLLHFASGKTKSSLSINCMCIQFFFLPIRNEEGIKRVITVKSSFSCLPAPIQ